MPTDPQAAVSRPLLTDFVVDDDQDLGQLHQAIASDRHAHEAQAERAIVATHLRRLTPRERAVLERIAARSSSKESATELGLRQEGGPFDAEAGSDGPARSSHAVARTDADDPARPRHRGR